MLALQIYNHKLIYENNSSTNNGTWGNNNSFYYTYGVGNDVYYNYHNTTSLFNFSIPSCTIWYCINRDGNLAKGAADYSVYEYIEYGRILYNHKLVYANTLDAIEYGNIGDNNYYNDNTHYSNYHNTTLLFGLIRKYIKKSLCGFSFYINYIKLSHLVLYGIVLICIVLMVLMLQFQISNGHILMVKFNIIIN